MTFKEFCEIKERDKLIALAQSISLDELKRLNPWQTNYLKPNFDKLFDEDARWLLKDDAEIVNDFNKKVSDDYQLMLGIRPEPFNGNPLTSKVVILSLNPGYVYRVNNLFARILQKMEPKEIANIVMEHKDKQLRLNVDSFFCRMKEYQDKDLVNTREAHCMLDDWYWYDIFTKFLKDAKGANLLTDDYSKEKLFDNIALVQYVGYMSKSWKPLPKGKLLPSQKFTRFLIWYLAYRTNVLFIVSRSQNEWNKLIGNDVWDMLKSNGRLVLRKKYDVQNKNGKDYKITIRTQYFSPNSFEKENDFKLIADKLKTL